MSNRLINIGKGLAASVVLIMILFGYVCYEKTLVAWWLPVSASVLLALLTFPLLYKCWRKVMGVKGFVNLLCHLYVIGGFSYFLLLGGNFLLSDASSAYKEEVHVLEKEHVVKTLSSRSGRRYRNVHRTIDCYYLTVCFSDGTCKKVQVALSAYNHTRKNGTFTFNMQKGLFGFRVIK